MIPFFEDVKGYILGLLGPPNATGGSMTAGTVNAKLNILMSELSLVPSQIDAIHRITRSQQLKTITASGMATQGASVRLDLPDNALIIAFALNMPTHWDFGSMVIRYNSAGTNNVTPLINANFVPQGAFNFWTRRFAFLNFVGTGQFFEVSVIGGGYTAALQAWYYEDVL